jgi:hypothetical protein
MTGGRCLRSVYLLVAAAAAVALTFSSVPAGAAAVDGWSTVAAETVTDQNFILNAVTVPAHDEVWAAGYHWEDVGGALEYRTLVEHLSGGRFVVVPTPDRETAPAIDFLEGISGTSATDVWAVGESSPPGRPAETLAEHWDGEAWSIVATPDPGDVGNILESVAAVSSTDVWAVGARQDRATFYQRPMAIHWDGSRWASVKLPEPTACTGHSYMTSVVATSADDVWATGWCGSGGTTPQQGYVEHFDGRSWILAAARGSIPAYSQLYGISAESTDNVWAVGFTQQPGTSTTLPLTVHWNGVSWSAVRLKPQGASANLQAVLAPRSGAPWAVGSGPSPQPPFTGPFTARYDRSSWQVAKVPVPYGSLAGIASDPASDRLWAVGTRLGKSGYDLPLIITR